MNEPPATSEILSTSSKKKAWALFLLLAASVAGLDLWSKAAVFDLLDVQSMMRPTSGGGEKIFVVTQRTRSVVTGFFELEANYNHGAFNGWFSEHTGLLALLSSAALLVIASVLWYSLGRAPAPALSFVIALGLLAGGTAGNFYDRFYLEAVRDWIKWYIVIDGKEHVWPNFNVADSGICVGVVLVVLPELRTLFQKKQPDSNGKPPDSGASPSSPQ
ncbi:MAG: signal peptidase II [Planctomycetota bacterium]|nr:signal peptidase II [Planctomycetota bacterium]